MTGQHEVVETSRGVRDPSEVGEVRRAFRRAVPLFVVAYVPFLFFFYDSFNLNDSLFGSGLLTLGITPYNPALGSTVAAGYPMLTFNQIGYSAYWASGFDVLVVAVVLKLILMAVTWATAWLLVRIALAERIRDWKVLFYSFLLNPFLLFVNVVWGETDILVLCAILVGFYFLRYGWYRDRNLVWLVVGAIATLWACYAYYWPFLLVPAFVVYAPSWKMRAVTGAVLGGMAGLLSLPVLLFGLSSFAVRGVMSGNLINPYSFLALFYPLSSSPFPVISAAAIAFAVVAACAIPLVYRRAGKDLSGAALWVIAVGLVLLITLAQADNFVVLVGLVPLALVYVGRDRVTYWQVFLLEASLLPLLWIVQMWNGPGLVSGVYYWAYPFLHQNVWMYQPLGGFWAWQACLVLYLFLIGFTLVWVYRADRGTKGLGAGAAIDSASGPSVPARRPATLFPRGPTSSARALIAVGVVSALVVGPIVLASLPGQTYSMESTGSFPDQLFIVHDFDSPNRYLMPGSDTFTASPAEGSLSIAASSPSLAFTRQLSGQSYDINGSISLTNPTRLNAGEHVPALNASGVELGFVNQTSIPGGQGPLPILQSSGLVRQSGAPLVLSNVSSYLSTNGSGIITYSLNAGGAPGHTLVFAGKMTRYAAAQNILWVLTQNGTAVLESYFVGQSFYFADYSNGAWSAVHTGTSIGLGEWFAAGWTTPSTPGSVIAWVNGLRLSEPFNWNENATYLLYVGKFGPNNASDARFSLIGDLSDVYKVAGNSPEFDVVTYTAFWNDSLALMTKPGTESTFDFAGSPTVGTLTVNGTGLSTDSGAPSFAIGKLSDGPYALHFRFFRVSFLTQPSLPLLPWIVTEFAVVPMVATGIVVGLLRGRPLWARKQRDEHPTDP